MPQAAIKFGQKKSRISPTLAAQMQAGAVVAGAPTVEEIEEEQTETKTPEQIAAELAANPPKKEKTAEEIAAEAAAAATKTPEQIAAETAAAKAPAELATKVTELETNVSALTTQLTTAKGVNDHLQAQLNTANETLGATKAQLTAATEAQTKLKAGNESLRKVVIGATQNLSVAFSTQAPVLDSLDDAALCTQYTSLRERFEKAFVTGGKSKASDEIKNPPSNLLEPGEEHPAASAAAKVTSLPHRKQVNK